MSTLFNPEKPDQKVILSIDGGGMRGIIPLCILIEMESRTGRPAYELFDMVAGTSTGAIIAAGLALKLSATEILEIYLTELPEAFGVGGLRRWLRYLFTGLRYFYPLEPFFDVLSPFAGDKQIKDVEDLIILLTTKDVRTGNTYYIVNEGPGAAAFGDWPLMGAVAASSAAPIYFPPILGNFIDGGVGVFGNPCLTAAIEAMDYIGPEGGFVDGEVILVAMGTGYPPEDEADNAAGGFWLGRWVPYIIGEGINDSAFQQVTITRKLYGQRLDFRRYNPYLTTESVTELGVDVAGRDPRTLSLDSTSAEELELLQAIGTAYAKHLDFAQADVMPWETTGGHPLPRLDASADWSRLPIPQ